MKPGEDGVFPAVIFHAGRYEYGTVRKFAISTKPVMTRIGFADSLQEAAQALEKLGWELDGNPLVTATGPYKNIPIKDA